MSLTSKLFNYCERGTDPAFWGEPLNAASNAAFVVASAVAFIAWRRLPASQRGTEELSLIALVLIIGIGSFLFHTFATRWAAIADVVPIGVFMLAYFGYALRRFVGWSPIAVTGGIAAFVAALAGAGRITCGGGACLNGSVGYIPAVIALGLTGGYLLQQRHPAALPLLTAAGIFAVSLVFRTLDRVACPFTLVASNWNLGTHALWHLLNAAVLYLLLSAAVNFANINKTNHI